MKKKTYSKPELFCQRVSNVTNIAFISIAAEWDISGENGWDNLEGEDCN